MGSFLSRILVRYNGISYYLYRIFIPNFRFYCHLIIHGTRFDGYVTLKVFTISFLYYVLEYINFFFKLIFFIAERRTFFLFSFNVIFLHLFCLIIVLLFNYCSDELLVFFSTITIICIAITYNLYILIYPADIISHTLTLFL